MPEANRRRLSRRGTAIPRSMGRRDPEGGGDRESQGRLPGKDAQACGSLRKHQGDERRSSSYLRDVWIQRRVIVVVGPLATSVDALPSEPHRGATTKRRASVAS